LGKLFTPGDHVLFVRAAHYACCSSLGKLFTPRDRVLLVRAAHYGRFILGGRCIDSSYGRMDCGRDVTAVVARNCSARRRCTFPVTSLHAAASSPGGGGGVGAGGGCPRDLTAHLLVKYTCLKGEEIELAPPSPRLLIRCRRQIVFVRHVRCGLIILTTEIGD